MVRGCFLMTQITLQDHRREESFGFLIQTIARTIEVKMKAELKTVGVDIRIFANLMALGREDGINQREIGARLNFPDYYTSRNVDALVEAGYAERRPDPDSRRTYLVYLTKAGRAKAKELPAIVARVNDEVLKDLPEKDQAALIGILQTVAGYD